ncbi:DNA polymerase subunit Cdc27-domain-containing protein [Zychaea mexicana]|uniref:DNA polymerase subunit Cdc27-domain-containing protein n=1 Tax=Zychaea mexicana TaxID=64656 RepID=UPI0022FF1B30|nr:DNA polymerase subunit Cdc27-domain-containing protein [Zychaea mexicana]KAI9496727.1 DNA polymerase subunit Cdc27-domain-containing protein [Zychaea mexicana]
MEEQLNITVLQEKRPVTYKSLARQHAIHVNTAKQALWDYAQNTPNVHAIYCIAGRLVVDSNATRDTIRLVKDLDLEETKKQFRQVTGIHVYSVVPYDPKLWCPQMYPSVIGQTHDTETYTARYCTYTTSDFIQTIQASCFNPCTSTSSCDTNKETNYYPEQSSARSSSSPTPTPPPQPAAAAVKTPEKQKTPEPKKPSLTAEDIFSEDEDMAESNPMQDEPIFDPMETDEPAAVEEEERRQTEEKEPEAEVEQEEQVQERVPKQSTAGRKRRRKVTKKKHYTNERGFLVTEDVEEYETVDEDEGEEESPAPSSSTTQRSTTTKSQSKPSSAPAPAAKKSGAKKTQGEQRNLLSFWGKK